MRQPALYCGQTVLACGNRALWREPRKVVGGLIVTASAYRLTSIGCALVGMLHALTKGGRLVSSTLSSQ